jgi:regulation of enolase protein 1 (concanavalin A-like superfamily)
MKFIEKFTGSQLPQSFHWFNPPAQFSLGSGLEIITEEKTDFWQKTHYGFQRDDGHCLLMTLTGDFAVTTQVEFRPQERYDQCGLMVRLDSQNWIKMSTEYESPEASRLGSVVTNLGYSDWATQDIASSHFGMHYRISKNGSDFLLENSFDGQRWLQMRIAHLHRQAESYEVGLYACSPIGKAYWCQFTSFEISENAWGL